MVSDLYVQQIKQFKPTPLSNKEIEESVKKFQLPGKPSIPEAEISSQALGEYESAPVEVQDAPSASQAAKPAGEEDWFVFEEAEEHH